MAPRTAKTKKSAEITEGAKKGRGKAKTVKEPEPDVPETDDIEENPPVIEKKNKRGKKAAIDANGLEQNGKIEEIAPPAKTGRKKNVEEPIADEKPESNDEQSGEEEIPTATEQGDIGIESLTKESKSASAGRGRKKQPKKEPVDKVKPEMKSSRGRGKNAKQETTENENTQKEDVEEKPRLAGKGRGRKAVNKGEETESEDKIEDDVKPEPPAAKGRKKHTKTAKEKTPESDAEEPEEMEEDEDDKPLGESKKKETKSRKNQGKKVQARENEDEEVTEDVPAPKKRKVVKKEEKGKGESKDEETEEILESKPAKGRRGQKKVETIVAESDDEPQDTGEVKKRKRKAAEEKVAADDTKKKAPAKNKASTNYDEIDFSNSAKNVQGKDWNFKISSWNVDGIRAWMSKGGLDYIKYEKPNILCLQEIKCSQDKLPEEIANLSGYHAYWLCSEKDGYAGVGIYTTKLAMNVQYGLQNEELDSEGRIITAEYEQFYLICTYVPNAGRKLVTLPKRLQWNEEFRKYVKELDKKKPVIICGDMNVSHKEIDLTNPKTNKKNAGFTNEERSGMTDLLGDGFVDTYRHLNPDKTGAYTFWTYMMSSRAKNVGWRLDYFIVSERLLQSLCDSVIRNDVYGSDHCPISLFLHLSTADKPKE